MKQMGSSDAYFMPPQMGGTTATAQGGNYSTNPNMFGTPQQQNYSTGGSSGFYPSTAPPSRHTPQNFYANVPRAQFSAAEQYTKNEPVW